MSATSKQKPCWQTAMKTPVSLNTFHIFCVALSFIFFQHSTQRFPLPSYPVVRIWQTNVNKIFSPHQGCCVLLADRMWICRQIHKSGIVHDETYPPMWEKRWEDQRHRDRHLIPWLPLFWESHSHLERTASWISLVVHPAMCKYKQDTRV